MNSIYFYFLEPSQTLKCYLLENYKTLMAARDLYHEIVVIALEKDGWNVTDDPLVIPAGKRKLKIDLGAEKLLAAEKEEEKIAVEIKTFSGLSEIYDFYTALGQYKFYLYTLSKASSPRTLFLAVSSDIYHEFFEETFIQEFIESEAMKILIFDITTKTVVEWIK
ncbi:MAG: element excision factor XisH family protein [Chitinophagales bacterium]